MLSIEELSRDEQLSRTGPGFHTFSEHSPALGKLLI
jgi:hypothetical protein